MVRIAVDSNEHTNGASCPGIDTNDTLLQYLLHNQWPVEVCKVDNISNDYTYYYPIYPQEFKLSMDVKGKNVMDHIPTTTISKLSTNKNLNLLIYFPWEGFDLNLFNYTVVKFLNMCVEKHNIPSEKIYFVYGDINIRNTITKLPVPCLVPKSNMIGLSIFEYVSYIDSTKNNLIPDTHLKSLKGFNRPKRFLFKNGNARPHRTFLLGAFKHLDILDKFYYSWLNHYGENFDDRYFNSFFRSFSLDSTPYEDYIEAFKQLNEKSPIVLDILPESMHSRENQIKQDNKYTINSYATLVSETVIDIENRGSLFMSEKTFQPLYQLHPFVTVSCAGTLEYLRKCGYETFPELFDEGYDKITDKAERLNHIVNTVKTFVNKPITEVNDIYYSDTFLDKLIHNRQIHAQRQGRSELFKLINWLTK